jgi:hypothetical protein
MAGTALPRSQAVAGHFALVAANIGTIRASSLGSLSRSRVQPLQSLRFAAQG